MGHAVYINVLWCYFLKVQMQLIHDSISQHCRLHISNTSNPKTQKNVCYSLRDIDMHHCIKPKAGVEILDTKMQTKIIILNQMQTY